MNKEVFAKIPNRIFSVKITNEYGKDTYTEKESIYNIVKDDKVFKVIYELMTETNFKDQCNTSINNLINLCGYKESDRNTKEFKNILYKLHDNGFIKIKNEFYRGNDIVIIDTEELFNLAKEGYTVLDNHELEKINNITNNNRQRNSLLRCYLFIKCLCHKRDDNTYVGLSFNGESQTISIDYNYIEKFTKVSDISKTIKLLSENKLIMYDNFLINMIGDTKNKQEAKNTYAIYSLEKDCDEKLTKEELKVGIKQYKNELMKKGFVISTKYKNNNKVSNGLKGKIKSELNKGNNTEKLENKLNKLEEK